MEGINYASSILIRAVEYEKSSRFTEALLCYQEGIQILLSSLKTIEESKRDKLKVSIKEYMERAEKIKTLIESLKASGKFREQKQIKENSTGFSYEYVFKEFFDHHVHQIEVEDPYIRSPHQCDNFLRFVETAIRFCPNLKIIYLKTGKDTNPEEQEKRLNKISTSIHTSKNITLKIEYSDFHDREIRLDNGWVVKIGRGLDYFKPCEKFSLGWNDFYFRQCKETTIDVFHKKELAKLH